MHVPGVSQCCHQSSLAPLYIPGSGTRFLKVPVRWSECGKRFREGRQPFCSGGGGGGGNEAICPKVAGPQPPAEPWTRPGDMGKQTDWSEQGKGYETL